MVTTKRSTGRRKSIICNATHSMMLGLSTPVAPPKRLRLNRNFTLIERVQLVYYAEKNDDLTLTELGMYAKNQFKFHTRPSKSCIWKVLADKESLPTLAELKRGQQEKRSSKSPELPELDTYLYNGVIEHQQNNFDETAIYYARSPTKTISSKPVSGVKMDKKRLTIGLLCSFDGEFRMNPCIIGKAKKPACFNRKTGNELGFLYYNNTKAWMTGEIFKQYFQLFNHRMRNLRRNVAVLLDNASCHNDTENYSNITFIFLPPNTTCRFQPLDAGIIQNFKTFYAKRRYILAAAEYSKIKRAIASDRPLTTKELQDTYNINQAQAMEFIRYVWEYDVKNKTIQNCWRHTRIIDFNTDIPITPMFDEDFSILSPSDTELEIEGLLQEIHGAQAKNYNTNSLFFYEDGQIHEEEDFFNDESVAIMIDTELDIDEEQVDLQKQRKEEMEKFKAVVNSLRFLVDNLSINDDEDFSFSITCNHMYEKYKKRIQAAQLVQSSISDHLKSLTIE